MFRKMFFIYLFRKRTQFKLLVQLNRRKKLYKKMGGGGEIHN